MVIKDSVLYDVENKDINKDGSFVIPDGVTSIASYTFAGCDRLTRITIPNNVKSIGSYSFCGCSDLTNVTIGNGITSIDLCAFAFCSKLPSIIIPSSVTRIGMDAFRGCSKLTSVIIPDSMTSIGDRAFCYCHGLMTEKSIYKAFEITKSGELKCINKIYKPNKWHTVRGDLILCKNGIHYCDNLFEIFNYYCGKLDDGIAIYECEIKGEDLQEKNSSKHCCKWLKPVKRLSREEIINILNNKGSEKC